MMVAALSGIGSIALKELRHIRRDPMSLVFAVMLPIMQLMLFGFAINFDVRHIPTAIVDLDHSRESRAWIKSVVNTQDLDTVAAMSTPQEAVEAIRRNDVRVALVIPPEFSRRWGTTTPPEVGVLIDGSDSQVANPARTAVLGPSTGGSVDIRINMLFNPDLRTEIYTVPGLLAVVLQLVTVALSSFSLVREREQGTLEQLMVTPVGRLGLMLGKLLPYWALAMFDMLLVVTLGRLIFKVPMAGNLALLIALSAPFVLAALGIGLLISTIAENQAQALQMSVMVTMPAILLSGYIAPRETLPGPLFIISDLLPVTYFVQIARGIMVRGAGFMDLLPQVAALCVLAVVLLTLSTLRFHKSVS